MDYKRLFIPNSLVFITIVTQNRKNILIDNIHFLRKSFFIIKQKYDFEIVAFVVNYDHLHMIIKPAEINLYPKIVGNIKSTFTKISGLQHNINNNRESDIWQRRYWEHTIRDEIDLCKYIDYIHYNPMKHYNIEPKNWEYSSFKRFVKQGYYDINWANQDDTFKVKDMDIE